MPALELKIYPPVLTLLVALAMWLLSHLGPVLDPAPASRWIVAAIVAGLGGALAFSAARGFRRVGTTIHPLRPQASSSLVTTGVHRFTRNPMYLGLLLVLLAWALALAAAWPLLGPPAFALYITRFQIRPEERALSKRFGAPYLDYTKRVRRWI